LALSLCLILALAALFACDGDSGSDNSAPLPTGSDGAFLARITFVSADGNDLELLAEIADAPAERGRGLMSRQSLPDNQSMLFVYEQEGQYSFWMKDTPLPLSIAFIKGDGRIVGIEEMEPLSLDGHSGDEPYLYVLEANQGWFTANGIAAGAQARITLPDPTPTAEPSPSASP
jgi:hypothetical protein